MFLVATIGTIALGLVVVNAGALYRLRYVFWIMFIIMAADSLAHFTVLRTRLTKSRMSSSVVSNDAMNRHSDVLFIPNVKEIFLLQRSDVLFGNLREHSVSFDRLRELYLRHFCQFSG